MRAADADAHLVIQLTNDTFSLQPGYTAAFIGGFDVVRTAQRLEANGWTAQVVPAMMRDLDAYLLDNQSVRLTFPQVAAYDILSPGERAARGGPVPGLGLGLGLG
mgnify:CR=1 FL=1